MTIRGKITDGSLPATLKQPCDCAPLTGHGAGIPALVPEKAVSGPFVIPFGAVCPVPQ